MDIKLDIRADALYITIKKGKIHKTLVKEGVIMDLDKKGDLIGMEILNYSKAVLEKAKISYTVATS